MVTGGSEWLREGPGGCGRVRVVAGGSGWLQEGLGLPTTTCFTL